MVYRNLKHFTEKELLAFVKLKNLSLDVNDSNQSYKFVSSQFESVINKPAPPQIKMTRGNNASLVDKTLKRNL